MTVCLNNRAHGQTPNIVVILTDDQGWSNTSVQMDPNVPGSKSDFYQTPRLEQLANAGMRFSNGYASASVCAPTRAAIQTGMSVAQLQIPDLPINAPGQSRWVRSERKGLTPPASEDLEPDAFTIPKMIKQANANYVTAHYGKWHLDFPTGISPATAGYDFDNPISPLPPDEVDPWGSFQIANLANNFMQDRVTNSEPFFMQLSHKAVHEPVRSRQVIRDKYAALPPGTVHNDPAFAAMTEDLDTSVGMVLDKITELGIEDNTYVVFVSDNGAQTTFSSNLPLSWGKSTIREGGIRVPFVVSGPNVAAGSVSDVPVTTTDLFTTIADLVGHNGPLPSELEGASIVPLLHNGGQLPAGTDHLTRNFHEGGELYWHRPVYSDTFNSPDSAVRDGDFKLRVRYGVDGQPDQHFLYDLTTDIAEATNLAGLMPQKVTELRGKLDRYLEAVDASQAYEVEANVVMEWDASQPGKDQNGWRSTIDLDYKGRETWKLDKTVNRPTQVQIASFQPMLPDHAFKFIGGDRMDRLFFHVGHDGLRVDTSDPTLSDFDRSATMEFWIRLDSLTQEQILFESGDGSAGISATLGDADADGLANDVRMRVLGLAGADTGGAGTLNDLTVTAKIDRFANPGDDFIHVVAVFNDDENDRYGEIYVNGTLAARVDGLTGATQSINWDGYDRAGLGGIGGSGLGGNGGTGDLPFNGGFQGDMALVKFYNHALTSSTIRGNYNSVLDPVDFGIHSVTGGAVTPVERPSNVSLNAQESSSLLVIEERSDTLASLLAVDAIVTGPVTLNSGNAGTAGSLLAGTDFTSYLLQFDPASNNGAIIESVIGSITFQQEILAILFDSVSLSGSDALLGAVGDYGNEIDRGLLLTGGDFITISPDQRTLIFDFSLAGDELLQFRVLTDQVLAADFDNNGIVNDVDLAIWQAAYAIDGTGDADFDGDTDGDDFLIWQQQLGSGALSTASAVPEPATVWLLAIAAVCGFTRMRISYANYS